MGTYTNQDGIKVRTGVDQAKVERIGGLQSAGADYELLVHMDYTDFAAYGTAKILSYNALLPVNALVISANFTTIEAFTSLGSPTLTIGTYKTDGTVKDADGIDAAIAMTAIDKIGETVNCDGAQVAGVAGERLIDENLFIGVTVGVADYTAGSGDLVIKYRIVQ